MKKGNDGLYTHAMIYSPMVDIIRDATPDEALLSRPIGTNFITAAAVNAGHARRRGVGDDTIRQTLAERAERVLALAAQRAHDGLVLGAWGCGVFQNEPEVVAGIFARLLSTSYRGTFKHVAFALRHDANRPAFERAVEQLVRTGAAATLGSGGGDEVAAATADGGLGRRRSSGRRQRPARWRLPLRMRARRRTVRGERGRRHRHRRRRPSNKGGAACAARNAACSQGGGRRRHGGGGARAAAAARGKAAPARVFSLPRPRF